MNTGLKSDIILGCMRMAEKSKEEAKRFIETSFDLGLNFFDHADIYGGGKSEEIFAGAIKETSIKREDIILQSKCGIRKGFFDFSKEHIINSTDGILKRLNTDYLDVLMLHRPDTLVEEEDIAESFDVLHKAGKVKNFAVSNMDALQIQLIQKYTKYKLIANQMQLSPVYTPIIDYGFNVNMKNDSGINRAGEIISYCRLNDINIQAWSPFQFGFFGGVFIDHEDYKEINDVLQRIADENKASKEAVVVAWLLRHPGNIKAVTGTMSPERIKKIKKASEIKLSREEWYEIYTSAGNKLP